MTGICIDGIPSKAYFVPPPISQFGDSKIGVKVNFLSRDELLYSMSPQMTNSSC